LRAGIAALQQGFTGVDFQTAFVFSATMAFDATGFEDGFDFPGEIDRVIGGGVIGRFAPE